MESELLKEKKNCSEIDELRQTGISLGATFILPLKTNRSSIFKLLLSPNSRFLVTCNEAAELIVWDLHANLQYWKATGHMLKLNDMLMTKNSECLISSGFDKMIILWDLLEKKKKTVLEGHGKGVHTLALANNENYLLSVDFECELCIWDMLTYSLLAKFQNFSSFSNTILFTPNDKFAIAASSTNTIKILNLHKNLIKSNLQGHTEGINVIALYANTKLLSAGSDKRIIIWDIKQKRLIGAMDGHADSITYLKVTSNCGFAVSASTDNSIRIWNLTFFSIEKVYQGACSNGNNIFLTQDDFYIFSLNTQKKVIRIDMKRQMLKEINWYKSELNFLTLENHDSDFVYPSDSSLYNFNNLSINNHTMITTQLSKIMLIAASLSRSYLISVETSGRIAIWDMDRKFLKAEINVCIKSVFAFAFTSDSKYFIYAGREKKIIVWNLEDDIEEAVFLGHSFWIRKIFITADNLFVISVSDDKSVRIWSIEKKIEIACFYNHSDLIKSILYEDRKYFQKDQQRKVVLWRSKYAKNVNVFNNVDGQKNRKYMVTVSDDNIAMVWKFRRILGSFQ